LEDVFDPTGAGDTFAGGFIGYLTSTGRTDFEAMKTGIVYGSALASYCVEQFGTTKLASITPEDVDARLAQFRLLMTEKA
jgi:sugar/nucleoside kinase (ribokinase family)